MNGILGILEFPPVAILLSIGVMVFLIKLGEAFAGAARRRPDPGRVDMAPMQSQIDQLRDELRLLRDTSTQHAMSLDRNVETLNERVGHMESKVEKVEEIRQRLGS